MAEVLTSLLEETTNYSHGAKLLRAGTPPGHCGEMGSSRDLLVFPPRAEVLRVQTPTG